MIEYQFAVSAEQIRTACTELFNLYMARSIPCNGYMMKKFGDIRPVGLLSFPTSGYTVNFLTDDTPEARKMLVHFTDILLELGGRVYLAKDSCILARQFERMYDRLPEWREIVRQYDPKNRVQSDLSRRLNMKPW
jgi:decaprenylphospho-beta-D-ribofuranose 2-oxidase